MSNSGNGRTAAVDSFVRSNTPRQTISRRRNNGRIEIEISETRRTTAKADGPMNGKWGRPPSSALQPHPKPALLPKFQAKHANEAALIALLELAARRHDR